MYVGMLPSSRAFCLHHLSVEGGHAETCWKVTCKVQPSMCPGCSHPTNQSRGLLRFLPVQHNRTGMGSPQINHCQMDYVTSKRCWVTPNSWGKWTSKLCSVTRQLQLDSRYNSGYNQILSQVPGVHFARPIGHIGWGNANWWITCLRFLWEGAHPVLLVSYGVEWIACKQGIWVITYKSSTSNQWDI
jgi:hypothetical protein